MMSTFNIADAAVAAVMLVGMISGMRKGIIVSICRIFSSVVSLAVSAAVTPAITSAVRNTFIYTKIYDYTASKINLSDFVISEKVQQSNIIEALNVPDFLKNLLMENNNNVIYNVLDANSINEYITKYIANIITQVYVSLIVFALVIIAVHTALRFLKQICKIPVIKQCNAVLGGIVGILCSVIFIWIGFTVLQIFILNPGFETILEKINESAIASVLYDKNVLLHLVQGII